jgi:hypothetical protein
MEPSFIGKKIEREQQYILTQEHHYVLPAKTSYTNVFSHNCLLQLPEPAKFYMAIDTTFQLLSTLFLSKPVPAELST